MKICSNCQKKIWFWNKFNREYGKGFLISRDFSKILEEVYFCCEDCLFEYKEDYNIDFNNKRYLNFKKHKGGIENGLHCKN
jgi:hypothetical protein